MPSDSAMKLKAEVESYLARGLKPKELLRCEEIVINFKPWVPFRFIEGLKTTIKGAGVRKGSWGLFYYPLTLLATHFRGFTRRNTLVRIRGRLRRIYDLCCLVAGNHFPEKELAAVLFLAEDCTDKEIDAAVQIARTYGLRHIYHLRGIILKNRATVIQPRLERIQLEGTNTEQVALWARSRYPEVQVLKDLYRWRVDKAIEEKRPLNFVWETLEYQEEKKNGDTTEETRDSLRLPDGPGDD